MQVSFRNIVLAVSVLLANVAFANVSASWAISQTRFVENTNQIPTVTVTISSDDGSDTADTCVTFEVDVVPLPNYFGCTTLDSPTTFTQPFPYGGVFTETTFHYTIHVGAAPWSQPPGNSFDITIVPPAFSL